MPGFTKSSQAGYYKFLFGDGSDGDLTVASNTNLASTLNGDIVYKNYRNLTINAGAILSVSNPCKGLWIRVRGVLTLDGSISMTGKGGLVSSGGNLYLCYNDIFIPVSGGAYGAAPGSGNIVGNPGADSTNGGCGGGGSGGSAQAMDRVQIGAHGSAGNEAAGGRGGGGAAAAKADGWSQVSAGETLPLAGGAGGNGGYSYWNGSKDDIWRTSNGTGGAGKIGGGILIIMANSIIGNGSLISNGENGLDGSIGGSESWNAAGSGGGGAGAGSIALFFALMSGTPTFQVNGGLGGNNVSGGAKGGNGGAGSARQWSLQQLLSHTRI